MATTWLSITSRISGIVQSSVNLNGVNAVVLQYSSKIFKTLVSVSPSPMLIWVSQWSQCFNIGEGEVTFQWENLCDE